MALNKNVLRHFLGGQAVQGGSCACQGGRGGAYKGRAGSRAALRHFGVRAPGGGAGGEGGPGGGDGGDGEVVVVYGTETVGDEWGAFLDDYLDKLPSLPTIPFFNPSPGGGTETDPPDDPCADLKAAVDDAQSSYDFWLNRQRDCAGTVGKGSFICNIVDDKVTDTANALRAAKHAAKDAGCSD